MAAGTDRWLARRSSVPRRSSRCFRAGATTFAPLGRLALVNGGPGVVVGPPGRVVAVVGFSVVGGLIREIDIIGDRAKLQGLQGG